MKKLFLLVTIIVMSILPLSVFAQTDVAPSTIEYLDDGSYFETIIEDIDPIEHNISVLATSKTVTKSKTTHYKNADGDTMWYVKVTGTFTYNGSTSKCTSSSVTAASQNSNWKVSNKSSSYTGSKAKASATGKKYFQGTVIQTINKTVTLTCSPSGTFS